MSDRDIHASIDQTQEAFTTGPSFEAVVRALGEALRQLKKAGLLHEQPDSAPTKQGEMAPPAGE